MKTANWLDRMTSSFAPVWTLKRQRARMATQLLQRHYEAAQGGRRTQGWRKSGGDANAVIGPAARALREVARDLVRNNPYAESALSTIVDHTVGTGIVPKSEPRAMKVWKAWAETTACDADGRNDIYGLQKLVMRTTPESGEVLVRRRFRRPDDGLPIPLQLQVIEPDYLDTSRSQDNLPNGGRIIDGVEFDAIGRRVAYWLYKDHPGSALLRASASQRVPASEILHIFKPLRPGQVRGPSWFAPVELRFKEFDEMEDATLMKQKIAACLAVFYSDMDGTTSPLGTNNPDDPMQDMLEPGLIKALPAGSQITTVAPPTTRDYPDFSKITLRSIATGLGVTYEDLTGDYADMPFSAARMSRLRHWARVDDWRWRLLIPQFCQPVWVWAMEAAAIMGQASADARVEWTAPPPPMVDPVNEGLAYQRNIRTGIQTWSEAVRERGLDPEAVLAEMVADNKKFDAAGIILDSDPRKTTQAGQLQGEALPDEPDPAPAREVERAMARWPSR